MESGEGEQSQTWELLNEELRYRMDVQRAAFSRVEARAGIVFAVAFAAMQFVAREPEESGWLPFVIAAYAGAMVLAGVIAVWPGRFEEFRPRSMLVGLWQYPPGRAAAELANNRLEALETNLGRQRSKVLVLRVSVGLLAVGAIMSAIHLTEGRPPAMSDDSPQASAAPVNPQESAPLAPQAPAPPPPEPPQPGVPTMNLLETVTSGANPDGWEQFDSGRGGEPPADTSGDG